MLHFSQQCCDANFYLELGYSCANDFSRCWDPFRPIGTSLYSSIPFRLGAPPEFLIIMNALLLLLSTFLGSRVIARLFRDGTSINPYLCFAISLLPHLLFMWGAVTTSLVDVPAAVCALIGLWLLVLGMDQDTGWMQIGAGVALALAALIRTAYLYPVLATVVFYCAARFCNGFRFRRELLLFPLAVLLVLAIQYQLTYYHTGQWSFADKKQTSGYINEYLLRSWYGYDTLVRPSRAYPYDAAECLQQPGGLLGAWEHRDIKGIACLLLKRQYFYFGSYVPGNAVYLSYPGERIFLPLLVSIHLLLALALAMFVKARKKGWAFMAPSLFLACTLAVVSLTSPETRYLMVVYVFLWAFGGASVCFHVLSGFFRRRGAC